jgi:hypothetical protein
MNVSYRKLALKGHKEKNLVYFSQVETPLHRMYIKNGLCVYWGKKHVCDVLKIQARAYYLLSQTHVKNCFNDRHVFVRSESHPLTYVHA